MGRFSQALRMPVAIFSRSKSSLRPSRLTTMMGFSSILSKVVNRRPHWMHSRRRRMAVLSSLGRLSTTLLSMLPQ